MSVPTTWRPIAAMMLACGLPVTSVAQETATQPPRATQVCRLDFHSFGLALDTELSRHTQRLLSTYAARLGRPLEVDRVEAALTLDRQAVFHAAVRAMFVPVSRGDSRVSDTVSDHLRAGGIDLNAATNLVAFVDAITGIWGARPGDTEGRHQFRVSVKWKSGLPKALSTSPCFSFGPPAHVILPGQTGDDANWAITPTVDTAGAVSYRSKVQICGMVEDFKSHGCTEAPTRTLALQVNYLHDTPDVGEFDIDFDAGQLRSEADALVVGSRGPHMSPSNSDPLAVGPEGWHLDMLNYHFRFSERLQFDCHDAHNHGKASYDRVTNCIRGGE